MESKPAIMLDGMTEEDGQAVCGWIYPAPYDRYRWPSWETMKRQGKEFGDTDIRKAQYLSARNERGELVGYVQLFKLDRTIRIGLGLRPDCCGKGLGTIVTRMAVEEAKLRQPEAEVDLEVEQWNRRAIRAYEKAGFVVTDEYERKAAHGIVSVYCMVWQSNAALTKSAPT